MFVRSPCCPYTVHAKYGMLAIFHVSMTQC
jgi:hypothetical protein